jgi:serine/threonine protein kinase
MKQTLSALLHCHARGIIHGDLHPANILFDDYQKQVFLIDFGEAIDTKTTKIPSGVKFGVKGFQAPELLKKKQGHYISTAIDIYSLGMTFAYWIMGVDSEIWKDSTAEIVQKVARLDEQAGDLVQQMLRDDANARITAAMALRHPYLFS